MRVPYSYISYVAYSIGPHTKNPFLGLFQYFTVVLHTAHEVLDLWYIRLGY